MNPLLMVWNLQEVAVTPFTHTFNKKYLWCWKLQEAAVYPLLMVWNLEEVVVKPCAHFYKEILMVLEASGGCCESIIDGLESRGGCCEALCALLQLNIDGFGSFRRLLRIYY